MLAPIHGNVVRLPRRLLFPRTPSAVSPVEGDPACCCCTAVDGILFDVHDLFGDVSI